MNKTDKNKYFNRKVIYVMTPRQLDFEVKLKKLLRLMIKEGEIIDKRAKEITGRNSYCFFRELYLYRGFKITTRVDGYRYHKLLTPIDQIDIEKCRVKK